MLRLGGHSSAFLQRQRGKPKLFMYLDTATIVGNDKVRHSATFCANELSIVTLNRNLNPGHNVNMGFLLHQYTELSC